MQLFHQYYKQCDELESADYQLFIEPAIDDRNMLSSILQEAAEKVFLIFFIFHLSCVVFLIFGHIFLSATLNNRKKSGNGN